MSDIVERFDPCATEACKHRCDKFCGDCREICIDEVESLRQKLAECQAREKVLREMNNLNDGN